MEKNSKSNSILTELSFSLNQNQNPTWWRKFQQKLWRILRSLYQSQHKVTKHDTVWLMDNTAYRSSQGEWKAEFIVAVFDQNTGAKKTSILADIAKKLELISEDIDKTRIQKRLTPCLQTVIPGRKVKIDFGQQCQLKMSPGGPVGISSDIKILPESISSGILTSMAIVPFGANGILEMKTHFVEPEGWGVISGSLKILLLFTHCFTPPIELIKVDIDDTIKVTQTAHTMGFIHETFAAEPTPVKGMPELYAQLQNMITSSSPFFYLSASPYNLYEFLLEFRQKYFPHGTIILRDYSLLDFRGLVYNLALGTLGAQAFKVDRMKKIYSWLPRRKMICIGDSTQFDPEAYGELYRKYPGWIKLILIRKVRGITVAGNGPRNEADRFELAFKGVERNHWFLFDSPEECHKILRNLILGNI